MSDAFLVTGIPGFIGSRLCKALLPQGRRLFLLCESRFEEEARRLAGELGGESDQVVVVTGDITEPDIGLSPDDAERVREEVSEVYHLAAIYDLAVPEAVATRVNVHGTRQVVDFLRTCSDEVRHNYISTCYVAGDREGIIFEDELVCGQSFKNHYESTKYHAEVIVEQSKADIETRIFRPAVVIGDSKTGETAKFDGPYASFGAVLMGALMIMPGSGEAPINLVPVDYVIDCLTTIPQQPETAGKTFQLADPDPLSSREVVELVAARMGAPKPRFALPVSLFRRVLGIQRISDLVGITPQSLEYFNHYQVFDATNTRTALEGTGVRCPRLPSYINQILRYYLERVRLPWNFARMS